MGINIGPWVLGLSLLSEDPRDNIVKERDSLEQGIIRKVFQGKLPLTGITRICLPQDSMSIPWNNLQDREKEREGGEGGWMERTFDYVCVMDSTCPLFSVFQTNSFTCSAVMLSPSSFLRLVSHTNTSWETGKNEIIIISHKQQNHSGIINRLLHPQVCSTLS